MNNKSALRQLNKLIKSTLENKYNFKFKSSDNIDGI